jgi:uncharacterized protein (TIGR00730 family)
MTKLTEPQRRFPDAREDLERWDRQPGTPQTRSPSYRLAFSDEDFLTRDELRPVRLQLELLKPEMALAERGVVSTIVMLGSARIPSPERRGAAAPRLTALGRYYDEAREFARLCTERALAGGNRDFVICTGGGPGIMEAGNRGAIEAGGKTVGLNIGLPFEQWPNPYITPELSFEFNYFFMRKFWFAYLAKALVVFPGGFGTMDELFELLTLTQTQKLQKQMSILLYGSGYWNEVINFPALVRHGTIAESDLELFKFADDPTTAFELLRDDLTRRYLLPEEPLPEGEQETPAIAKSRDPEDATVQK